MDFSYTWSLKNDAVKLAQIRKNVNVLPLGSGALAGNPFDIDRNSLADSLGFDGVTENSMQAVGDRDFVGKTPLSSITYHFTRRVYCLRIRALFQTLGYFFGRNNM